MQKYSKSPNHTYDMRDAVFENLGIHAKDLIGLSPIATLELGNEMLFEAARLECDGVISVGECDLACEMIYDMMENNRV